MADGEIIVAQAYDGMAGGFCRTEDGEIIVAQACDGRAGGFCRTERLLWHRHVTAGQEDSVGRRDYCGTGM